MKLEKALTDSYEFSGKLSDIARQLAFVGIATIWIFKFESEGIIIIPHSLHLPAFCFVLSLVMDLLQYSVSTITWTLFHRYYEKKITDPKEQAKKEIYAPPEINWVTWFLFWIKISCVFIGHINLLNYIVYSYL